MTEAMSRYFANYFSFFLSTYKSIKTQNTKKGVLHSLLIKHCHNSKKLQALDSIIDTGYGKELT